MSSARARANHSLYLARILIRAWQGATDVAELPVPVLAQTYAPGCRAHLLDAYGWFLLAISSPDSLPDAPPRGLDELAPIPAGKAVPGELREFAHLESDGWLGDLLAELTFRPGQVAKRDPRNLAAPVASGPDPEIFAGWADELAALFDRMGDSLDEY